MPSDSLSTTLAAVAHPARRSILARLARGAATVKELSAPFPLSAPAVSRHLRVLEKAGLIRRGRDAQWRPCTLEAGPLKEVAEWAQEYRGFWDGEGRLDVYLAHLRRRRGPV
jgi:DNA-binding transcriptional ArsR family regulator